MIPSRGGLMIYFAVHKFINRHGYERFIEVIEILNDGKPSPQERIALLVHITNEQVSVGIGQWFDWKAGVTRETADTSRLLAELARNQAEEKKQNVKARVNQVSLEYVSIERKT